jgi:hypothetical protein
VDRPKADTWCPVGVYDLLISEFAHPDLSVILDDCLSPV